MASDLQQADKDSMLVAEVAALSVSDPSVWDHFMDGWIKDVKRRISERYPDATAGSAGPSIGANASVGSAATGGG